jgi:hypothetical protein
MWGRTMGRAARIGLLVVGLLIGAGERAMANGEFFKAGDRAPDFTSPANGDRTVHLAEVLQKHPVVLVFLRGFG